jgi:hypothetical protein
MAVKVNIEGKFTESECEIKLKIKGLEEFFTKVCGKGKSDVKEDELELVEKLFAELDDENTQNKREEILLPNKGGILIVLN